MKRLALFAAMAVAVTLVAAGGLASIGRVSAVNQVQTVSYDMGLGCLTAADCPAGGLAGDPTAAGQHPTQEISLKLDTACLVPGCVTASTQPFFDIAVALYDAGVTFPASGSRPGFGSKIGVNNFQINTNQVGLLGADNVSSVTGAPPACGSPSTGTIQITQAFDIINAVVSTGVTIPGTDQNANGLPDTQDDVSPANGVPDGADKMPDYIKTLLGGSAALMVGRGFGIASIIPNVVQVDVNFLTLDLSVAGGSGYAAVTTLGNTDTSYDPKASQASLTCTPFISQTKTFGISVSGPAGCQPTCNGGTPTRTIIGATGSAIHYSFAISATEDSDNDGVPIGLDRCPTNAASGTLDTDGDGLGDACDPFPLSVNNTTGGASNAPYPTKQTTSGAGLLGDTVGHATWHPDQDIDGDGVLNASDNCPTVPNRDQKDSDSDGVGNACDQNPGSPHAGGPCAPVPTTTAPDAALKACAGSTRDGWSGGGQGLPVGTDFPSAGCNPVTTCNLPARGTSGGNEASGDTIFDDGFVIGQGSEGNTAGGGTIGGADPNPPVNFPYNDSNDDGFADFFAGGQNVLVAGDPGLAAVNDINSDSDQDGCSDNYEAKGFCGGNPLNADTNNNGILDGAEDFNLNGIADWRDDVAGVGAGAIAHSSSSNPNGGGSPDSDNDGCSNRRESVIGATSIILNAGGGRDALNPYDFADVPTAPNSAAGLRDKTVKLGDVLAALQYVGTSSGNVNTPNGNGVTYGGSGATVTIPGDSNNDGRSNGAEYDRVAGAVPGTSKAPNGVITLGDVLVILAQVGANCAPSS